MTVQRRNPYHLEGVRLGQGVSLSRVVPRAIERNDGPLA